MLSAFDAHEWLPPMNRCWFAARVVAVKRKYALTATTRGRFPGARAIGLHLDRDDHERRYRYPPGPSPAMTLRKYRSK